MRALGYNERVEGKEASGEWGMEGRLVQEYIFYVWIREQDSR